MEQTEVVKRTIDIENIFREKSPNVARFIPGFVFSYLRKIIHEDTVNDVIYRNREFYGLAFVERLIEEFGVDLIVEGKENVPTTGRYIIAANHPLGGLDGIALMHEVGKIREDIIFPVNDLLLFLQNLKPLFIPINKHGSNSENLKIIQDTFESDKLMLYFPAGLVSRKQNGKIEDLEWKKTFIAKAKQFKRDIIPTHVDGRNSNFFYNLALIRAKLGMKANVEMLYLPDELFKQKGKTVTIKFGKPIPYSTFDKRFSYPEWANQVKKYVYAMGNGFDEPFDAAIDYSKKY